MLPRIVKAGYRDSYKIALTFSDGVTAVMDFRDKVVGRGGVFEPLENVEFFARFEVDREAGTLVWPNGVDFCPDALYSEATGAPFPSLNKASRPA